MSDSHGDDPSPSEHPSVALDTQGLQRRRLMMKAAAGVPAVVTLLSGRRLAAGTFENSCLRENSVKAGRGLGNRCVNNVGDPGDEYLRFPETAFPAGPGYPGGGTINVDISTNTGAGNGNANDWCIAYVDANGNLAGQNTGGVDRVGGNTAANDNPTAGYYAVTDSCWASFSN